MFYFILVIILQYIIAIENTRIDTTKLIIIDNLNFYYEDPSIDISSYLINKANYNKYIKQKTNPSFQLIFGSCFNNKYKSNYSDIFKSITNNPSLINPDMFIWLGDATYASSISKLTDKYSDSFINKLTEFYFNLTKDNYYYNKFINKGKQININNNSNGNSNNILFNEEKTFIVGIWDDHDFGINDGDENFIFKDITKKHFLNFINEEINSIRRNINNSIDASYSMYYTNSQNKIDLEKSIRLILIDTRYYKKTYNLYYKIKDYISINYFTLFYLREFKTYQDYLKKRSDIISENQWSFIENQLHTSKEKYIIIANGTQILPFDRGYSESWNVSSRKRLIDLIIKHKKSGVIFLSGDIHQAQNLRTYCIIKELGYHIYEFTSSGLTHRADSIINNVFKYYTNNKYNYSDIISSINYGCLKFDFKDDVNKIPILSVSYFNYNNELLLKIAIDYNSLIFNNNNNINNEYCYYYINSFGILSGFLYLTNELLSLVLYKIYYETLMHKNMLLVKSSVAITIFIIVYFIIRLYNNKTKAKYTLNKLILNKKQI